MLPRYTQGEVLQKSHFSVSLPLRCALDPGLSIPYSVFVRIYACSSLRHILRVRSALRPCVAPFSPHMPLPDTPLPIIIFPAWIVGAAPPSPSLPRPSQSYPAIMSPISLHRSAGPPVKRLPCRLLNSPTGFYGGRRPETPYGSTLHSKKYTIPSRTATSFALLRHVIALDDLTMSPLP